MPILNLKLDNILAFNDFEINFSFPKKLNSSFINDENLKNFSNFRYKKINILLGSNASGKTSLIVCIWKILFFLKRKDSEKLLSLVNQQNKDSFITLDYATDDNYGAFLYRIKIIISTQDADKSSNIKIAYCKLPLAKNSSYENLKNRLDTYNYNYKNYQETLNELSLNYGWNISLPATEYSFTLIRIINCDRNSKDEEEYIHILNIVFKTLDPAIKNIFRSNDTDDAYVIDHATVGKIVVQNEDNILKLDKLSSGTKYGFNIANLIYSIKNQRNEIYLIDEQFSYVNSDVEKAFISLITSLLKNNEQLFITTHNPEVLSLNLPFHSFYFMKRIYNDETLKIVSRCASEIENRNNVNLKNLISNDIFATAPNVENLLELGD